MNNDLEDQAVRADNNAFSRETTRVRELPPLAFTYKGYSIKVVTHIGRHETAAAREAPVQYVSTVAQYDIHILPPGVHSFRVLKYYVNAGGRVIIGLETGARYLEGVCVSNRGVLELTEEVPCEYAPAAYTLRGAGLSHVRPYIDAHIAHREYWQLDAFRARVTTLFEEDGVHEEGAEIHQAVVAAGVRPPQP